MDNFLCEHNIDWRLFLAVFLFSIAYLVFRNFGKEEKENPDKCCLIFFCLFKAFLISGAVTLIFGYFEEKWLLKIISKTDTGDGFITTILSLIGIFIAFLAGISVFVFHLIHERSQGQIQTVINDILIKEKEYKILKTNMQAFNILSELYEKSFQAYLRYTVLKEQRSAEIGRVIPEIIPVFSSYRDDSGARGCIQEAFHVLDNSDIAPGLLSTKSWEYIEKEILPTYEKDKELYDLILKVIKKNSSKN